MGGKLTLLSPALASAASCATPRRLPDSAWHDEARTKWRNEVSKMFTGSLACSQLARWSLAKPFEVADFVLQTNS